EAAAVADRALADAERSADPFATGYALHAQSSMSFIGRDLAAALARIDRALAAIGTAGQALIVAERAGTSRLAVLRCALAYQHSEAGHWDDALAEVEPAVGADPGAGSSLAHGLIALISGYRDDGDVAAAHLGAVSAQGDRAAAAGGNSHYLHLARAVAEERAGRPGAAVAALAACLAPGAAMRMPA